MDIVNLRFSQNWLSDTQKIFLIQFAYSDENNFTKFVVSTLFLSFWIELTRYFD